MSCIYRPRCDPAAFLPRPDAAPSRSRPAIGCVRDDPGGAWSDIQYEPQRASIFDRGTFRVRGDVIDSLSAEYEARPCASSSSATRSSRSPKIDPLTGEGRIGRLQAIRAVYPARTTTWSTRETTSERAIDGIQVELRERLEVDLRPMNRRCSRPSGWSSGRFDVEMLSEIGVCQGIENYSRYLERTREPAKRRRTPARLLPG